MKATRNHIRKNILLAAAGAVVLAGMIWLAVRLWQIILPFFYAVLLAYLLRPAVNRIAGRGVRRGVAVLIVYCYLAIALYLLIFLCGPVFLAQGRELLAALPGWAAALQAASDHLFHSLERLALPAAWLQALEQLLSDLPLQIATRFAGWTGRLPNLLLTLFDLILTPILSFYFLLEHHEQRRLAIALLPRQRRAEILRLCGVADRLVKRFIRGYLVVAVVITVLSALLYWAIGLNYALVLAIIMGLADLIPYFGPYLGAIPALIIAGVQGGGYLIATGVGILLLQQAESAVIMPRLLGARIGLPPLPTIFVVMAGGVLGGVLGALLAVPLTAVLLLAIRYLYQRTVGVKQCDLQAAGKNGTAGTTTG